MSQMKKKRRNPLPWIVLFIMLVVQAITVFSVLRLNMLPEKYLIVFLAFFALLDVIIIPCLLIRGGKGKKNKGTGKRVVAYILATFITVSCGLSIPLITKFSETIRSITNAPTIRTRVGVYVMKDDPAQTIDDAAAYQFGATEYYDSEATQTAISAIEDHLGQQINSKKFETIYSVIDSFYSGGVNAVVLTGSDLGVLDSMALTDGTEKYADFIDKVKCIYEYEVAVKQEDNGARPVSPTTEPFIVYLSGSDTRNKMLSTSRSDVNILAVVNPTTKQILLLNTPRDYYVPNPAGGGALDKLTHCGIYGIDCSQQALSDLYDQPIAYYAQINFTGFETLIDAVGGIKVYSDKEFTSFNGIHFDKGENYLDGQEALAFARERKAFATGDNARGQNQMKVIAAVIEKLSASTILSNYSGILDSLQGMFVTDIPAGTISQLIKMQLSDMSSWNIVSYAVTGKGGSERTYSAPGYNAYVMYPDNEMVNKASELIDRVFEGEILTQEDVK